MENCEGCLALEKAKMETITQGLEHDTMIEGVNNRMHIIEQKVDEVKTDVANLKEDFRAWQKDQKAEFVGWKAELKTEIPEMLTQAINKLLARLAIIFVVVLIACVIFVIFALTRPIILKGLEEIKHKVETMEIVE